MALPSGTARLIALTASSLLLTGCSTVPPPTPEQIEEAVAFALAHSDLPPAPPPPVHLASSSWMGSRIGFADSELADSGQVRGLYLFSCRCIYLDQYSWTMPILVHEMVHYLEHEAGLPPGHRRADPVGELYAKLNAGKFLAAGPEPNYTAIPSSLGARGLPAE